MLKNVHRFAAIGALTCAILVAACQPVPSLEGADAAADGVPGGGGALAGNWQWQTSERGGEVIRRAGPADSMVLQIGPYGGYREYTGGKPIRSHYWLAEGRLYELQDSAFLVLLLDSTNFFPRGQNRRTAVAVRSLDARTLVLSGTGTDATFHTFSRVAWEW